jgi:hypothetical protein
MNNTFKIFLLKRSLGIAILSKKVKAKMEEF